MFVTEMIGVLSVLNSELLTVAVKSYYGIPGSLNQSVTSVNNKVLTVHTGFFLYHSQEISSFGNPQTNLCGNNNPATVTKPLPHFNVEYKY